jgi:hypothetical protein
VTGGRSEREVSADEKTRYSHCSWDQLIEESRNAGVTGPMYEAQRRLVLAGQRQGRSSTWLTVAIIALMVVQIVIAVWQAARS